MGHSHDKRCSRQCFAVLALFSWAGLLGPARHVEASSSDTLWVGRSSTASQNYWWIGPGAGKPGVSSDGYWGWDNFGPGPSDPLMGWWPIRLPYLMTGGLTLPDYQRTWTANNFGNQACYPPMSPGGRTFGVTGIWHVDGGNTAPGPTTATTPSWAPISGTGSAWCGLRAHGDDSYVDRTDLGGTGNPFNQDVLDFSYASSSAGSSTAKLFPGYPRQTLQFLYRDFQVQPGASYALDFDALWDLANTPDRDPATKTGYFKYGPDCPDCPPDNFISASNASPSNAPVDSFSVFLAPAEILAGAGPILEKWCRENPVACAEVIEYLLKNAIKLASYANKYFAQPHHDHIPIQYLPPEHQSYSVVFMVQSTTAPGMVMVPPANSGGPLKGILPFLKQKPQGSKGQQGPGPSPMAAVTEATGSVPQVAPQGVVIDNVDLVVNGSAYRFGSFDSAAEIDNQPEPGGYAFNTWKTFGIAPRTTCHVASLDALTYQDPCGPPSSPLRQCDMSGTVISTGDADLFESQNGPFGGVDQERFDGLISPTINLVTNGTTPNAQGIDAVHAQGDILLKYDLYTGALDTPNTGTSWTIGAQSYPATMVNGAPCWGDIIIPDHQVYWPTPWCMTNIQSLYALGLIRTSNPSGVPDSIRVFLGRLTQCFRFGLSSGCGPTTGLYFDNVSVGFVPEVPVSEALSVEPWDWIQDAFPFNSTPGLPGTAAFDTCAVLIRTGFNLAQATGNAQRPTIAGDTTVVVAPGAGTRVDMVFRILPGVGNYVTVGNRSSGLRRVPTDATPIAPGDHSFWSEYIADPGEFATPGGAALDAGWPSGWNWNVWRSARCDTAEINLFPVDSPTPAAGLWASMYHESDPKFTTLGIEKHRCFLVDTAGAAVSTNITCTDVPAWVTNPGTGYSGDPITREYTKIIPDGLLTPGAHVEYFFRRSPLLSPASATMVPDTNRIAPQPGEMSDDGHRWQEFSALPDRWKSTAFGGMGMACMLFVDLADGHGVERAWVGVADSIGATAAARYGAHNGWHATGDVDYYGKTLAELPPIAVAQHGGQPGTIWDMYGVRGGDAPITRAAGIGSRLATLGTGLAAGRDTRVGPTREMLTAYYRIIMLLSGDLSRNLLGPFRDNSQDDISILRDFAETAGLGSPRAIWVEGDGFVEAEDLLAGLDPSHGSFLSDVLGVQLRNPSYMLLSSNTAEFIGLEASGQLDGGHGSRFGLENPCSATHDVLQVNSQVPGVSAAASYDNIGVNGPYIASVYAPSSTWRPWSALVDGWDTRLLASPYGANERGRLLYFFEAISYLFGDLCSLTGGPLADTPPAASLLKQDEVGVGPNPGRFGVTEVRLSLAAPDRVAVRIHDVSGRVVRVLADWQMGAGVHVLPWDGRDDRGQSLRAGVYFASVQYAGRRFSARKKIVLLR